MSTKTSSSSEWLHVVDSSLPPIEVTPEEDALFAQLALSSDAAPRQPLDGFTLQPAPKYSHYFRDCPYHAIDVYRICELFNVTDPCLQHALKKVLVAGSRGHKASQQDVQEAIDTLVRWQAMRAEETRSPD
jgi:hypothetical protein